MVEPSKEPEEKKAKPSPVVNAERSITGEIFPEKKDGPESTQQDTLPVEMPETEKQQFARDNKDKVEKQIRLEIEKMQLNPTLEDEAKKKANKIEFLGEQEKIEHLIVMAQEQGLAFAIRVAKEMNDPYLLDVFHDILVKEGFYKRFLKQ